MKIIGLTGQSGAGKGTVATLFAEHGIPSIDTDAVYHKLLVPPSPCLNELAGEFSNAILAPDGTLDRRALAALVFEQTEIGRQRHERLNEITHRYVIERTAALLAEYEKQGCKAAIIDAPLLIEAGLHHRCDHVIAVLADREIRVKRLMQRDKLTLEQISERLDAQPDVSFYIDHATMLIYNNGTAQELKSSVSSLLPEVLA
ncbi:MAG: dephospho-CoA kinase [Clostridia bacterium]|nr:dephospho-CoA kinase [Clostridia bacterium]